MQNKTIRIGDTFTSSSGLTYFVVEVFDDDKCLIRFKESGNIQKYSCNAIYDNAVIKDYATELYCGVGYAIGTLSNPIDKNTIAFKQWKGILGRCYYNGRPKCYKDVTISADWHCFNTFEEWYNVEKRPLMDTLFIEPFDVCIDKDLFSDDKCKCYSPITCCILPRDLNSCIHGLELSNKSTIRLTTERRNRLIALINKYGTLLSNRVLNRLEWVLAQSKENEELLKRTTIEKRLKATIYFNGNKYTAKTIDELKEIIKLIDTV